MALICVTVKRLGETDPLRAPYRSCHSAAHVLLYAVNVALRSLKLFNANRHMPGLGAVPIGGQQPFGSVSSYSCLRGAWELTLL